MNYSIKHKVLTFILSVCLIVGIGSAISGCSTVTSTTPAPVTSSTIRNSNKIYTGSMFSTVGIKFKLN